MFYGSLASIDVDVVCLLDYTLFFISNTFIGDTRLKLAKN